MLQFALAVFFLIVTPGPGVLSTAGVGAAFGFRAGLAYVVGLFVGNNTVAMLVLTGIAAIAFTVPWLRGVLLITSVLYLLAGLADRTRGYRYRFYRCAKTAGILERPIVADH